MTLPASSVWVLSDGRRGIENQALGLAEALQRQAPPNAPLRITRKIIGSDPSFAALPPALQILRKPKPVKYGLAAPFPDIAIGCGRQAIAPLRMLKKYSPETFIIYVQDPRGSYTHFDLIIAPAHDGLERSNALSIIGSPNRITEAKLTAAKEECEEKISQYSAPHAAMLIGGTSKHQFIDDEHLRRHMDTANMLLGKGVSIFLTLSRRTDDTARAAWAKFAKAHPNRVWFYDEKAMPTAPNPYWAFLRTADYIFVTQDSTNMLTEAYFTAAPVYRLPMAGTAGKFERLYQALDQYRETPPIEDALMTPKTLCKPLRETDQIAKSVWDKINTARNIS